jgi:peptidoglycan-associated lipoprotein
MNKKLILSVVLVNLLAACAGNKPKEVVTAPDVVASAAAIEKAPSATVTSPVVAAPVAPAVMTFDALDDPHSVLAKRSFYFPLDVDSVQDADKPAVQAHGKYLGEHAKRAVRVEGNADERGSSEYNLALGQRRADHVKKTLVLSGAKDGQVEAVSYGEEKPKSTGHDESAWSQNRRADVNYGK